MIAIETTAQIDDKGILQLDKPLRIVNKRVKIIILLPEEGDIGEQEWLYAATANPAFDFLKEETENIYTLSDGNPINDEA